MPYSAEKAVCGEPIVTRMGTTVDAISGLVSNSIEKNRALPFFVIWACCRSQLPQLGYQVLCGRLVRSLEFRRPLFCLLRETWSDIQKSYIGLRTEICSELLLVAAAMPLAVTNIRASISGEVTASGASEYGGGLCVSTGTTPEVAQLLSSTTQPEDHQLRLASFMNGGHVNTSELERKPYFEGFRRPCCLVLDVCGGCGALAVSCVRLGCTIINMAYLGPTWNLSRSTVAFSS